MPLGRILTAHVLAVAAVTVAVAIGLFIDAGSGSPWVALLAMTPLAFLIVYVTTAPFIIGVRRWFLTNGWNGYWHALLAGALFGVILYGLFATVMNGREILSEGPLALSVIASGAGLGALGGLVFLWAERFLGRRSDRIQKEVSEL